MATESQRRGKDHPLIVALMRHLPAVGETWPVGKHARFMAAVEANIRLVYDLPVPPDRPQHRIYNTEPPY